MSKLLCPSSGVNILKKTWFPISYDRLTTVEIQDISEVVVRMETGLRQIKHRQPVPNRCYSNQKCLIPAANGNSLKEPPFLNYRKMRTGTLV